MEKPITQEEIEDFKKSWGQTEDEAKEAFGLEDDISSFMLSDYFYDDKDNKWYNKCSSLFTDREQEIADYLRNLN